MLGLYGFLHRRTGVTQALALGLYGFLHRRTGVTQALVLGLYGFLHRRTGVTQALILGLYEFLHRRIGVIQALVLGLYGMIILPCGDPTEVICSSISPHKAPIEGSMGFYIAIEPTHDTPAPTPHTRLYWGHNGYPLPASMSHRGSTNSGRSIAEHP